MSFSKRPGKNTPQCYTKPLDSLKNWNNRFFWVDERVFPTVVDWRTSAPKDGMPAESTYSITAVRALDTHRTLIQKQPEMLLCLVRISHRYYLGDEVYPTFLHDDDRGRYGPVQFNPCPESHKDGGPGRSYRLVGCTIHHREVPLGLCQRSWGLRPGNRGPEVPPPEDVPAIGAPEAGQAEEVAATDPSAVTESRKRGRDGADVNAPPKVLRRDHAVPRPTGSAREGKSLAAIELGMASTRPIPVPKNALVDVSDPDPLSFADPQSRHPADVAQSSQGTTAAGDPKSGNASFASAVGSSESIYRPEWGVANGSMLDTPEACQDLVYHVAPPGGDGVAAATEEAVININKLHQPWRSFAAVINKCLSGKSTCYDSIRLSQAQILQGMYHKKNVDFAYLLWEDFVYQVEHKEAKKSNEMYYPRFTKVIIHFFMTKDPSIPRRNKVNWHYVRDDQMFTTIKLVSRHPNTQQFDAILPIELTNEDIRNSAAYKEYHVVASGAAPLKTKSVRKTQSSFDTTITPPTAAGTRLSTSAKGKQPAKSTKSKDEGTGTLLGVLDVPTDESDEEISWKSSDEDNDDEVDDRSDDQEDEDDKDDDDQDDNDDDQDTDNDGDDFVHPKLSIHEEEAKYEESFDPIIQTSEKSDDEGNFDASLGMNVGGEEGQDAEDDDKELYRDVNINLEGRDMQMTDVHTTQEFKDTHVTLTPVNPDGLQQSSSMSSQFGTSMLNPSSDAGIDSLFESTLWVDVQASTTVASLTLTTPTLPPPTIPTISSSTSTNSSNNCSKHISAGSSKFWLVVQIRPSSQDLGSQLLRMNEAVKVAVQLQSDRLRDEAQAENEDFINKHDENIQKFIKEQLEAEVLTRSSNSSKTSYAVAADQSELELKKIQIEKMESNKSIHRSNEQRNLYKALVDAYECDKLILDIYGDTVTLKRRRDDADKDEEPSTGSDRGSKRRREGKEPESTSTPKEKSTKTTGKSTEGSKSHQKTTIESAPAKEPIDLAKQADSRSLFNELMDTPMDFLAFLMNRLKVDTLTLELLAGPIYELMKGSCKSIVELEFFLQEVYKATTDQLDWNNPEGQQYPHNLLKPLPLIPNSRGRRVIPFDHFINNDLEYLRGGASSRKYTTFVTKTKAADYGHIEWIEDLSTGSLLEMSTQNVESSLSPNFRSSNDMITSIWIGSLKADKSHGRRTLCFQRLSKNVYKKHRHPTACGRSSTRRRKLPKEAQPHKAGYNKDKQNGLMRIDELHKFSYGTLNDVRTALDDRLKGIRMKYLPQAIWRRSDKERASAMIQAIDKQLKTRRIMRSLEKFVGGRLYEGDFRCYNEPYDLSYDVLIIQRILKDRGEGTCFQLSQRFIAACSYPTNKYKDIMKAQIYVSRLSLL
nr:hypothetical protein [Tanacetum cinerariifolium]